MAMASFALMLALLPASATLIGVMVLAQIPSGQDMIGVRLVMSGVAIHKPSAPETPIKDVESTAP
jgi:inner membrane transporter RhtA